MIGIIICTTECNLNCDYCYEHNTLQQEKIRNRRDINNIFSEEKDNIVEFASMLSLVSKRKNRSSQIILHGGEPLLIQEDILTELLKSLKTGGCNNVQIQTNGTLITPTIVEILKQNRVKVTISLDGSREINDRYRKDYGGKGSFDRIMRNIHLLISGGVDVSILTTVTEQSYKHARQIYDFFNDLKLDFSVNRCFDTDNNDSSRGPSLSEEKYKYFLSELYDLYFNSKEKGIAIPCFDRSLHDLKKTINGYDYNPSDAALVSVFNVEKSTYSVVGDNDVKSYKSFEDYLCLLEETMSGSDSSRNKEYKGQLKKCIINHLCWQQRQDYYAALKVN